MSRRSLRHPFRGDHRYPRPVRRRRPGRPRRVHQPRMRPRRQVNVAGLVASPEEQPSRPSLRLQVVGLIVLALFAVMVLRLWSLSVIDHSRYTAAVNRNEVRDVTVPAPRGLIVDRHNTVLVGNQVQQQIALSRAQALQDPAIIGSVAALVGVPPSQIEQDLNNSQYSPYEPVPVLTGASMSTVEWLESHQSEFPGVSVQPVSVRTYPQNQPAGQPVATAVLGYVSQINAAELKAHANAGYTQASQYGQSGLENEYEPYLRGTEGLKRVAVNPQGQQVGVVSETPPRPGDTLVTNIDLGLQEAVQTALNTDIQADRRTFDPVAGQYPTANDAAAVVMNARNGQVLAMASYPTYDLSEWVGGISQAQYNQLTSTCQTVSVTTACPLINYAIDGLYTPGSTFKLNTATAALDDGLINGSTLVNDTGSFTVPNCHGGGRCTFHDAEAVGAGLVNVTTALTISDDYFFYNLGYLFYTDPNPALRLGIQQTAAAYGLGHPTGIDLPGEASGQVDGPALRAAQHKADPKAFPYGTYYVGDNLETAFGQGETLITPIQEATAYGTFANGGTRYQPQVVNSIVSPTGKVIKRFAPKVMGHVSLPPSTYQPMLAGFSGVVQQPSGLAYGTFQQYAHFPESSFPVAGKTGTADTNSGEPNAWFVGFGPTNAAPSEPEYVVAVVVDHGGYGAAAAAPAVARIFDYLYSNPVQPVQLPTASHQPTTTAPSTVPPIGTPPPPTTTTVPGG
ncbi:MAG: penicillin-binding protein 2 [Acidimicrobiales bacterium]